MDINLQKTTTSDKIEEQNDRNSEHASQEERNYVIVKLS